MLSNDVVDVYYSEKSDADASSDMQYDSPLTYDCECNCEDEFLFEISMSAKVGLHFIGYKKERKTDVEDYKFHKYVEKLHPCGIIKSKCFFMARNNLR